jgi:hypothetical protein
MVKIDGFIARRFFLIKNFAAGYFFVDLQSLSERCQRSKIPCKFL